MNRTYSVKTPDQSWLDFRLKFIASVAVSNVDKHSLEGHTPVRLCNYIDVYNNDRITDDLDFMSSTASVEQIHRYTLKTGDVLITKDSETPFDIAVAALVTQEIQGLVCGYHLAIVRPRISIVTPSFLFRLFQAASTAAYFAKAANGITRYGLTQYAIKNVSFAIPSLPQQAAIGDLLDRETAEADALLAKYERLIELLKEKRSSVITQIVTKGLDRNTPMNDSGIGWLGKIPAGWAHRRVKFCATKIGSGVTPRGGADVYVSAGVAFLRSQNIYDDGLRVDDVVYISHDVDADMSRTRLQEHDVLLNITGASIGRTCIVPNDILPANVNQHVCIIRPADNVFPAYLSYSLKATTIHDQILSDENGSSREGLNYEQVGNLTILIPPNLDEQQRLVEALDQRTAEIDALIEKARHGITLVTEHRLALITAAVTGKIDGLTNEATDTKVPA